MSRRRSPRPARNLPTTQARTELPRLVRELLAVDRPSGSLADHAIEVGPRNRGGVWILPALDAEAAIDREQALLDRVQQLEDEAENIAFGLFLARRLQESPGGSMSGADFLRHLGFDDLAADLPQ